MAAAMVLVTALPVVLSSVESVVLSASGGSAVAGGGAVLALVVAAGLDRLFRSGVWQSRAQSG